MKDALRRPSAPRTCEHDAATASERRDNLTHVELASDHLARWDRLVGWEEIAASLPGHLSSICANHGASCVMDGA
jgi:hypothetical protein